MNVVVTLVVFGLFCLVVTVVVLFLRLVELRSQVEYLSDIVNGLCKDNGRLRVAQSSTTKEVLKLYNRVKAS